MFYDYTLFKTIVETKENKIGQDVLTYSKGEPFDADIQPITGEFKASMGWGDDVQGQLVCYTDENINIGDIVYFNGTYEIEQKVAWDYFIYTLKAVEVEWV